MGSISEDRTHAAVVRSTEDLCVMHASISAAGVMKLVGIKDVGSNKDGQHHK
jgi:hypothetical protein